MNCTASLFSLVLVPAPARPSQAICEQKHRHMDRTSVRFELVSSHMYRGRGREQGGRERGRGRGIGRDGGRGEGERGRKERGGLRGR